MQNPVTQSSTYNLRDASSSPNAKWRVSAGPVESQRNQIANACSHSEPQCSTGTSQGTCLSQLHPPRPPCTAPGDTGHRHSPRAPVAGARGTRPLPAAPPGANLASLRASLNTCKYSS